MRNSFIRFCGTLLTLGALLFAPIPSTSAAQLSLFQSGPPTRPGPPLYVIEWVMPREFAEKLRPRRSPRGSKQ
jgi:hypothetical protein